MEHFLFDLDGTLLPMDQQKFVEFYMPLLGLVSRAEACLRKS